MLLRAICPIFYNRPLSIPSFFFSFVIISLPHLQRIHSSSDYILSSKIHRYCSNPKPCGNQRIGYMPPFLRHCDAATKGKFPALTKISKIFTNSSKTSFPVFHKKLNHHHTMASEPPENRPIRPQPRFAAEAPGTNRQTKQLQIFKIPNRQIVIYITSFHFIFHFIFNFSLTPLSK